MSGKGGGMPRPAFLRSATVVLAAPKRLIMLALVLLASAAGIAASELTADRVLVVYNATWTEDQDRDGVQDSLEVARYYARKRGIPALNVVGLPITQSGWGAYYLDQPRLIAEVLIPLKNALSALGPASIDAILMCHGTPSASTSSGTTI